jgi:hypothetical protein
MNETHFTITIFIVLLLIASGVAMVTRWIRVPYTLALVLVGLLISPLRFLPVVHQSLSLLLVCDPLAWRRPSSNPLDGAYYLGRGLIVLPRESFTALVRPQRSLWSSRSIYPQYPSNLCVKKWPILRACFLEIFPRP